MDSTTDRELLARHCQGDPEAFRALVERHESALLRHARAIAPGDRALAEDAVQDALMRLIERPPRVPETESTAEATAPESVAAWLHQVTRNACLDRLRGESRRRRRESERALSEREGALDGRVEQADTRAAVERGLERLSADQREVLALRLFGERSYAEIALITGKRVGTVGWLVSTGLRALSRELEPLLGLEAERPAQATSIGGRAS